MKRGAETQLTKEAIEEGYVEPEQTPGTSFKKAPDEILKNRVIRGLPNRTKSSSAQSNGTTASPSFPPTVTSTVTFPSATNSFTTPLPASNSNSPFAKSDNQINSFGTSSPFSQPAFAFPSSSDTLISSAPSSTSKAFASVLSNSNSSIFGSLTPSNPSSSSNQPATADEDDPVLFKYYINLRGLNHSLLNTISKSIEDDPFADMSGILEAYKSTRRKIQKDKDDIPAASKPESSSNSSSSNFFLSGNPPAQGAQSSLSILNSSNETPTQSVFGSRDFGSSKCETSSSTPFTLKFGGSTTNPSLPSIFGSSNPAPTFNWRATADKPAASDLTGLSDNSSVTLTPAASSAVHFQLGSGSSGITQSQSKTAMSADGKTADDAADEEGSEQTTPAREEAGESSESVPNLLATRNPHDDEGEGEGNEITVHAIKAKAYRMKKADEKGGPGWADLGSGILRLKTDKDTSARRMLLRNSTNGKILINFKIYSGLKPSLVKKALTFVGHDNGVSQTYCVRLPGEEQAQQLKEALDQEIGSVTAKDEA